MGNKVNKATENVCNRMSIRRRRLNDDNATEYTDEYILNKFQNIPTLSEEERQVLRSSWQIIQQKMDRTGAQTFVRMFESHPDTQYIFPKFRGIDLTALEQSLVIVQHGTRVMGIIDGVITNMDNKQDLWDLLIGIGRQHFAYGALPMYFDLMGPHFVISIRSTLGDEWYEALEYHWLALFNVVTYIMKFGWNMQRIDEQSRARNLTAGTTTGNGTNGWCQASQSSP